MRFRRAPLLLIAFALAAQAQPRKSGVAFRPATRARTAARVNTTGTAPTCGSTACKMLYYGGKVIPNAKVYVINWTAAVAPQGDLGAFYDAVTNSTYLDWLNEYDTNITPNGPGGAPTGTSQFIGRGVYAGSFTITPSASNASGTCPSAAPSGSTCITDAQIQSELNAQIATGMLPAPDDNSLYMTYFPPRTFISDGSQPPSYSCAGGGFCGYHNTYKDSTREFYYGVLPDHGFGSGCDVGCGGASCTSATDPSCFNNLTSTSGHELLESITDAEVGLSGWTSVGWYDNGGSPAHGEIGDVCSTAEPVTGTTFIVQDMFSNVVAATDAAHACVASRVAANDFYVSIAANKKAITGGTSITVAISTTPANGTPGPLTLSYSGLAAHVTGSLDKTSVTAGSGAILTLTADSTAAAVADAIVQIKAADGSNIHTAGLLLNVVPAGAADFSLGITPPGSGTTLAQGGKASWTINAVAVSGAPANIALTASGLPTGVSSSFIPATIQPGGSSTLTLSAAAGAPGASNATFTVKGVDSDNVSHSVTGQVSVSAPPVTNDFGLSLAPASASVMQGQSAVVTVDTALVSGAAETIALAASGLPSGVTATFNPPSVTAGAASTLTLSASLSSALVSGTAFTVTGTAASATHSTPGSLTVAASSTPTVSITSPANFASVSGSVEIDATAAAGAGATLLKVELLVDGVVVAAPTSSPAQGFWQSTENANGAHVITARAVDSSGSSTLSTPVTVTVNNAGSTTASTSSGGGGCASSGAGLAALLGIVVLLKRRRVT